VNTLANTNPRRFCEDGIWNVLTSEQMRELASACVPRSYARDNTLFLQDSQASGLYCIRQGQVLLSQVDHFGNETAFRLAFGGEVIGYRSLFAEQPHAATARTLASTSVCFIPRSTIWGLRSRNHALDGSFLKALACDRGFADAPLLRNPLLPLRVRFAHLLTVLRAHLGHVEGEAVCYEIALTQRDTGALLGARPETIARMHRNFEEEGLCRFRRGEIQILNYAGVLEIIGLGGRPRHSQA